MRRHTPGRTGGIALALVILLTAACNRTPPDARAYVDAIGAFRADKDALFRTDGGPFTPEERQSFRGLVYFDPDPRAVVVATLERFAESDTVRFVTSHQTFDTYLRVARAHFELDGRPLALTVYRSLEGGHLFVPFTDRTTGKETYGAGRYLDPEPAADDRLTLDFNRAYNPYCAYAAHWVCPVPPAENHLDIAVRAGEKVRGDGH